MKKKAMVALLVFVIATLEKCKRSLGDNNTINPARYTLSFLVLDFSYLFV